MIFLRLSDRTLGEPDFPTVPSLCSGCRDGAK
jgi:hypothetical protein